MKLLEFTCPECKCNTLEAVETDCVIVSTISHIYINNNGHGIISHGRETTTESKTDRYQCASCGYIVVDSKSKNITDPDELVSWIKIIQPHTETNNHA